MIQSVVAQTRMKLIQDLMMIPLDDISDVNKGQVSLINWPVLQDNIAETAIGWLFLDDIQNQFSVNGSWWLFNWMFTDPRLKRRFI